MHSALIWSFRLLSQAEQELLANAAVFAGGWTLEAAQAVCFELPSERTEWLLGQLAAKSLVVVAVGKTERRYHLLEPVRQFAQLQLQMLGMTEQVQQRHAYYFLDVAQQMGKARDTPQEREWLERLEPERDNIRAVNTWAIEHNEREFAHRLNGALFALWIYRSSITEARNWYNSILAMPMAETQRKPSHSELIAEAAALNAAGYVSILSLHYDRAKMRFEQELALRIELGAPTGIAEALRGCSFVAMLVGDLDKAEKLSEQAMATSRSVNDHWGIAWSYYDLGYIAFEAGKLDMAQLLLHTAIPQLHMLGINFGLYRAYIAHGHTMRLMSHRSQAKDSYRDALKLHQHMRYHHYVADIFEALAAIAADELAVVQAALLFGAADSHRKAIAMPRWLHQQARYDANLDLARSQLSPEQWQEAWEHGAAMSLEQAVAYALGMRW